MSDRIDAIPLKPLTNGAIMEAECHVRARILRVVRLAAPRRVILFVCLLQSAKPAFICISLLAPSTYDPLTQQRQKIQRDNPRSLVPVA